jgi:uncharacterized membrane protein
MVDESSPGTEQVLEAHEEWGESTRNVGIGAAVLAVAAALTANIRMVGRSLSVLAALVALVAGYSVAQAGHYGGELVYRHGAGVKTTGSIGASAPESAQGEASQTRQESDND